MIVKVFLEESNYKLYNDDAYDWIKNNNIYVDHIITDPPYNISKNNNFQSMKNCRRGIYFGDWDKNFNLYDWIDYYSKIINNNGSFIIFCSYRYLSYIIDRLENNNFIVKDILKWIKNNPMPRNRDRRYVQDTEYIVWSVKKGSKWVFNRPQELPYLRSEFRLPIVMGKEKTIHPTQKPLKLMEEIIKIHTNKNDIILDPFMGSGSTGIASYLQGRKFIGIENSDIFFEVALQRFECLNIKNEKKKCLTKKNTKCYNKNNNNYVVIKN